MRIVGHFATRTVRVDGRELSPRPSLHVWNHSPDGFSWGYHGSGPAQLALAILLAAGQSPLAASALHQHFKREFVATWKGDFDVEVDVEQWASKTHERLCLEAVR